MRCPKCFAEPGPNDLLASPCPDCGFMWVDTYQYVYRLADGLGVETVLDIGCGKKGVIGQHFWEHVQPIKQGYACDIHVVKDLPALWTPLVMDAEDLLEKLGPRSIDFVTHCGMLEHVEYDKALRILRVLEQVAKKTVFFTCSAVLREVDFKCKADGNPNHRYCSFWDGPVFEALGYTVDYARMKGVGGPHGKEATFSEEVTGWYCPENLTEPWEIRRDRAIKLLCTRHCNHTDGAKFCANEPIVWDPKAEVHYCISHYKGNVPIGPHGPEGDKKGPLSRWRDRADFDETFPFPPWRDKWQTKNSDDPVSDRRDAK